LFGLRTDLMKGLHQPTRMVVFKALRDQGPGRIVHMGPLALPQSAGKIVFQPGRIGISQLLQALFLDFPTLDIVKEDVIHPGGGRRSVLVEPAVFRPGEFASHPRII